MGKLLTFKKTFQWEDSKIDRGTSISKLNGAIIKSKKYDDLYKTPDISSIEISWGNFMQFIFEYGYEADVRKEVFPWMTQQQHTTLVYILSSFKNTPDINIQDLNKLKEKFPNDNCGYIGFEQDDIEEDYVACEMTWTLFHRNFVKNFNRYQRLENKEYFIDFYDPILKIDINQINKSIEKRRLNPLFKRVDKPSYDPKGNLLHGEKIQVHFTDNDESALNIDGKWKHKKLDLPDEICEILVEWGFILPENI